MASADLTSEYECATLESDSTLRTYTSRTYVAPTDTVFQLRVINVGNANAVVVLHNTTVTNTDPAAPAQADGERILTPGDQIVLPRGRNTFRHRAGTTATVLCVENIA